MALRTAIGLMSGTSMDGIDLALLRTDGEHVVERGPSGFIPYSASTIEQIKQALEDAKKCTHRDERPGNLSDVEEMVTSLHIDAVLRFLDENNLTSKDIDLLGFHGQTVLHRPDEGYTIQLGDGAALAGATGIDCVYDLRANDMEHGGQGAPLVPIYHKALSKSVAEKFSQKNICFVNIGGITNITYLGEELIAFDCGPGNTLIDQWVQAHVGIPYDQGGMIAAEGAIDPKLAQQYLSHSYLSQKLPKSLDRNDFLPPAVSAGSVETVARTLCHVTAAATIGANALLPEPVGLWVISGGGRHNPHIMEDLKKLASSQDAEVIPAEQAGFDGDAMEAECWAYLAVRSQRNLPITFPQTTGSSHPVSGGKLARA